MLIIACILVVFWQQDSVHTEDVSVRSYNFTGKDIRLVGGNSELEGRVEILINGTWGTICYDGNFDIRDADVLCRMLHSNLSALEYYTGSRYGYGIGSIFYSQIACWGTEQTIHMCSSDTGVFCSHLSDVGLMCTGCPRTAVHTYGQFEHVNITTNGDLYTGNCSNGTSTFQFMYRCGLNGSWEEYGQKCGPIDVRDVRFVGGVGPYDGGVEVLVGDTWGPVCGYSYENGRSYYSFAAVFCTMKGLKYVTHRTTWRQNTTNGFIGHVQCPSNADHVNSCNYTTVYLCTYQLSVACEGIGFCASLFNVDYAYSVRYPMIRDLQCSGQESHINNCTYTTPHSFTNYEKGAVTLLCTECGRVNVFGVMEIYIHTIKTLTVRCHNNRSRLAQYTCENNGSWSHIEECRPVVIQDIRLVNPNQLHLYRGYLELKINDVWGTICKDTLFGAEEETVVCRMITARNESIAVSGGRSGNVHITNLICSGSEKDVSECLYRSESCIYPYSDAFVHCEGRPLVIQEIRLVNGSSNNDGRVEIKVLDTWGTVCDDDFGIEDALVICKMMGFPFAVGFHTSYHAGTGPIFVDDMACGANSSHINDCFYVTKHNCGHHEDTSVTCSECPVLTVSGGSLTYNSNGTIATLICDVGKSILNASTFFCKDRQWSSQNANCLTNPRLNITDVRLVDGPSSNVGRVEIALGGVYGKICDVYFDYVDADVICKSLNSSYRAALYFTDVRYDEGTGPVHIDQLHCSGSETSLDKCLYVKNGQCNQSRDVSLLCNGK
ncbi:scavenger receptor cysteine-rich type 1 protein M130-like [Dreissena polymorpha]|uniref:scavenger receptor cysteine-rich type 1 protein M130-like n=1 Tax=Dreissena polymorpha TaxID=45954 RepID=UPI0022644ABE|nr:scavenger receptor cysteine-rich type 1 protein M130-like [Dreissena polymorpha]